MAEDLVKLKKLRDIGIIVPEGEIVFENSNPLKKEVKNKIKKAEDINKLIVDLERVSYLDSSGVGFLISLLKFMRQQDGKMVLTNINDKVERVIELTKLDGIIDIYDNSEKALEDFAGNYNSNGLNDQ